MRNRLAILVILVLAGCGGAEVRETTTARPAAVAPAPQRNGAIFQDVSYRPMFEDRRARYIGDTLTVVINEKTQASRNADGSASRDAAVKMGVPVVAGVMPGKTLQGTGLEANAASKLENKEAASASNLFTGTIQVTVVEQLANGNLVVAGEKQIGINGDIETLRFSGVVSPMHITSNSVSSTNVADARIEASSKTTFKPEQILGFMGRFFLSFLPFR